MKILEALDKGDGVYILGHAGLNSNAVYLEVHKDGKVVEKTMPIYMNSKGEEFYDEVIDKAKELSDKYGGLEVLDGTSMNFSVFSGDYFISDYSEDKYTSRGARKLDFTDKDKDDIDDRPVNTAKWAICTSPGKFIIYDQVTKNPWKQFNPGAPIDDTRRRVDALKYLFDKNSDKTYEGSWDDIKNEDYLVLVNNRLYSSESVGKIFKAINQADLSIEDERFVSNILVGTKFDEYGEEVDDVIKLRTSSSLWGKDMEEMQSNLTKVYDACTCAGDYFPEKFYITPSDNKKESYDIYLGLVYNNNVIIVDESTYNRFMTIESGDIIRTGTYTKFGIHGDSYYAVVNKESNYFEVVECTNNKKYGYSDYVSRNFDLEKARKIINGNYRSNEKVKIYITDTFNYRVDEYYSKKVKEEN